MALRLSKHCLYVNSQNRESFKEALWNASDSHGESLLQLKCFSRSPRYSLWMLEKYGVYLFFFFSFFVCYNKRHVNKEAVSICCLLGESVAVHKREVVCAKKRRKIVLPKKTAKICQVEDAASYLLVQECIFLISHRTHTQREANQFLRLISEIMCPNRRRLWGF